MDSNKKLSFISKGLDGVSLNIVNVGYEKCERLHSWGVGIRDNFLIHHITSGKGVYRTPNGHFSLTAGDTFLIYPNTEISYTADRDDPWEYYWTGFSGRDAEIIISQTDFSRTHPVIASECGDTVRDRISEIYQNRGYAPSDMLRMTGQLYLLLSLFISAPSSANAETSRFESYVMTAERFVSGNYSLNISVEDIAASAGISRTTLFRAFKEITGISPVEYLTRFRTDRAARLLMETDLSVSAVSNSVGYEDSLYFSKVFRKYKGISPTEARKLYI